MVKTRQKSKHSNQKQSTQNKSNVQKTLLTPERKQKSFKIDKELSIDSPIRQKNKHNIEWAPKMERQFELSEASYKKCGKNPQLDSLLSQYSYFVDSQDPNKIISYLNEETFSVVLRKKQNEVIQLLQQMRSIEKLIHKNKQFISPLLSVDWIVIRKDLLINKEVRQIISHIEIADKTLYLKLNIQNPECLNRFSHIKFDSLTRLQLIKTNITNLQPLSWLNCPSIQYIEIQQSCLASVKPLNKTNFKNLLYLEIRNTKISYPGINRMKFNTKSKTKIRFLQDNSQFLIPLRFGFRTPIEPLMISIQDIKQMCKLEGNFDVLKPNSYSRCIKQEKAFLALKRKKQNPQQEQSESGSD